MTADEIRRIAIDRFQGLCDAFGYHVAQADGFGVRFENQEVFIGVSWDARRSGELGICVGLRKGIVWEFERPFMLSELLRAAEHFELPEAQMKEIVANSSDVGNALQHSVTLLTQYARPALRFDRDFYNQLDSQRDIDCQRYQYERELDIAGRAAMVAWSNGRLTDVVSLLTPYADRLTPKEQKIFDEAKTHAVKD